MDGLCHITWNSTVTVIQTTLVNLIVRAWQKVFAHLKMSKVPETSGWLLQIQIKAVNMQDVTPHVHCSLILTGEIHMLGILQHSLQLISIVAQEPSIQTQPVQEVQIQTWHTLKLCTAIVMRMHGLTMMLSGLKHAHLISSRSVSNSTTLESY